jgi:hypothetical protein
MKPMELLSVLWTLWKNEVLPPSQIIKILNFYGYNLYYLGNGGLEVIKDYITYRFDAV